MRKTQWTWLVTPVLAVIIFVLDRYSKNWVIRNLALYEPHVPIPALGDFLRFTYATNTGAAFGLFQDRGVLFIIIAFVVIAAILVYSRYLPSGQLWVRLSLGLQLGGAVGNLVDRLQQGHVTDFIDVGVGNARWWTFNVADSAIVVGVIVLGLVVLLDKSPHEQIEQSESPQES